jgi:hypothetical protein
MIARVPGIGLRNAQRIVEPQAAAGAVRGLVAPALQHEEDCTVHHHGGLFSGAMRVRPSTCGARWPRRRSR